MLLNIAVFVLPVQAYKSYAAHEVADNIEGGRQCHDKLAAIEARKQKLIDDYNALDRGE